MAGADPNPTPQVAQSEIDAALAAGSEPATERKEPDTLNDVASSSGESSPGALSQDDLAALVAASAPSAHATDGPRDAAPMSRSEVAMDLPDFNAQTPTGTDSTIDLLSDVELNVKIELGRTEMLIEDVLRIGEGSVVELDKLAGDPVDVLVNDRLVARGEILVLNDNFCVRISEIIPHGAEAIRA